MIQIDGGSGPVVAVAVAVARMNESFIYQISQNG